MIFAGMKRLPSNGDYKVSVKASITKNSTGKYHIQFYYIQNDGSRVGVGTTTTEVEFRNAMTKTQASIKNVNSGAGTYTVTVDQAPQGRQIKNIRVLPGLKPIKKISTGIQQHLQVCIPKCRSLQRIINTRKETTQPRLCGLCRMVEWRL